MTEISAAAHQPPTGMAFARRLSSTLILVAVSLLSVMLLIFIAHGNMRRVYEQLLLEKTASQAELVRNPLENFVRPGLPLRQYSGFSQITGSILEGDKSIVSMVVESQEGELVLSSGDVTTRTIPRAEIKVELHNDGEIRKTANEVQIILPLKNKFERVGQLVVTMERASISQSMNELMNRDLMIGFGVCALFGLFVFHFSRGAFLNDRRMIAMAFTACFMAVSVAIVISMISTFKIAAQAKGQALVASLGGRLDDVPQLGLQFDQLEGVDVVLGSYRQLNPEISSIAVVVNGRIAVHTDSAKIGTPWSSSPEQSEYRSMLTAPNHPRAAQVVLSVPRNIAFWNVVRNAKNYVALFVASAFFAVLFLQVARVIRDAADSSMNTGAEWRSDLALELVKPVFFLAVFVDHLSYSFLPQFIGALASGQSAASLAWPFMTYYLCFALALVPAGKVSQRIGPRNLVIIGLALIATGLAAMAMVNSLATAVAARAVTGTGQGILFIGVQCYVLANARRDNRTRSNGIIVYGFQAGMISGMAIGSLLVGELGASGVFAIAASVAAAAAVYCLTLMPLDSLAEQSETDKRADRSNVFSWIQSLSLLKDPQFAQAILLIGIPAKAILTGVILFGMPLMLSSLGFAKEDIGQLTMIYAAFVMLTSWLAGHLADRLQTCRTLLTVGTILTAVGAMVIAAAAHDAIVNNPNAWIFKIALFALGTAVIGCAHGLTNAPVVTYITDTAVSARFGEAEVAAGYRFIERFGHMIGPVLVGQLINAYGLGPQTMMRIALVMLVFGIIFHTFNPAAAKAGSKEGLV